MGFIRDSRDTAYRQYNTDSNMIRDNGVLLEPAINTQLTTGVPPARVRTEGSNVRYLSGAIEALSAINFFQPIAIIPPPYQCFELSRFFVYNDTGGTVTPHAIQIEGNLITTLDAVISGGFIFFDGVVYFSE